MGVRDLLQRPLIIRLGQLAVTGEWTLRGHKMMAEEILCGPHESVLDLGSGRSPLLEYLQPERYVGLDLHPPDLEYARRQLGRPGYEFVRADILEEDLGRWQGVDVATSFGVFHHLSDNEVVALIDRVAARVRPKRMLFSDAVVIGPLRGPIARLDYGGPTRPKEHPFSLFRPKFEVGEVWSYNTRLRAGHVFGFEIKPVNDAAQRARTAHT